MKQLPGDTVLMPRAGQRPLASTGLRTTALAPELLTQSVRRLRVLALLYAFTFFMAGFFPSLLLAEERAHFFQESMHWVPGVVSIAMALLGAAFPPAQRPKALGALSGITGLAVLSGPLIA